jgi:hypothetical protein
MEGELNMPKTTNYFCWILDDELSDADRLRWIFDFIDRDIHALKKESVDFLLALERYLFRKKPHTGPLSGAFIMEESPSMSELTTSKNFERMLSIQSTLRGIADKFRPLCLKEATEIKGLGEMKYSYDLRVRNTSNGAEFFIEPQITGDDTQRAVYELLNLLNGVHASNFGLCKVCGRFFFGYKRDTQYCSTKCNWRINQRRYREQRVKDAGESEASVQAVGTMTRLKPVSKKKTSPAVK